ncbi:hydroxyethylthiazole kinase [Mangrovicoccus algicola]|uniref:Hydroxyethylthiazole kinase n=1 Tax=Mangrovicoccus algicola TaxID=2771008 RepID=A0A8J7CHT5_9RHOB|nr:hydroxyethylthiazole kinase [Mangrovicoccus algicola]MBE3638655.1 hydroxyethylthiazole kinase [Mangrovicoccus algicola]
MTALEETLATAPAEALSRMRAAVPLVQCITNYVAMTYAANVLLAAGASPAMVHAAEESGDFAAIAGALTVNIGTLSPDWVAGMEAAIAGAHGAGTPWVLDPVACFATRYRGQVTRDLAARRPAIIRGNASEILWLGGTSGSGKGADAGDEVAAATGAARRLAAETGAVVAVTGAEDFLTDGSRGLWIAGGSPVMPRVTATGCALTALAGGYAAIAEPFDAALAALMHFAVAGERAAATAAGPGSFVPAFLDALAAVAPGDMGLQRVRPA